MQIKKCSRIRDGEDELDGVECGDGIEQEHGQGLGGVVERALARGSAREIAGARAANGNGGSAARGKEVEPSQRDGGAGDQVDRGRKVERDLVGGARQRRRVLNIRRSRVEVAHCVANNNKAKSEVSTTQSFDWALPANTGPSPTAARVVEDAGTISTDESSEVRMVGVTPAADVDGLFTPNVNAVSLLAGMAVLAVAVRVPVDCTQAKGFTKEAPSTKMAALFGVMEPVRPASPPQKVSPRKGALELPRSAAPETMILSPARRARDGRTVTTITASWDACVVEVLTCAVVHVATAMQQPAGSETRSLATRHHADLSRPAAQ